MCSVLESPICPRKFLLYSYIVRDFTTCGSTGRLLILWLQEHLPFCGEFQSRVAAVGCRPDISGKPVKVKACCDIIELRALIVTSHKKLMHASGVIVRRGPAGAYSLLIADYDDHGDSLSCKNPRRTCIFRQAKGPDRSRDPALAGRLS
jgi:hypothetical protein